MFVVLIGKYNFFLFHLLKSWTFRYPRALVYILSLKLDLIEVERWGGLVSKTETSFCNEFSRLHWKEYGMKDPLSILIKHQVVYLGDPWLMQVSSFVFILIVKMDSNTLLHEMYWKILIWILRLACCESMCWWFLRMYALLFWLHYWSMLWWCLLFSK